MGRSVAMVTLTTEMLERGERIMARAATTTTTYSCGGGLLRRGSRAGARVRMSSVNVRRDVVVAKCRAEKKFFELKRKGRKCKSKNGVKCFAALGQDEDLMFILNTIRGAEALDQDPDFYALLGIEHGAAPEVVKQAYRNRARKCHPDIAGEDGHEACIYLNEAYATLMDDELRRSYDRERTEFGSQFSGLKDVMKKAEFAAALTKTPYTGEPLSKQVDSSHFACKVDKEDLENQARQLQKSVFVDEITCIGCMNCACTAPGVFRMEDKIEEAMDTCPVECIHWVSKEQLAPLEYVMQNVLTARLNVGLMRAGQGRHRLEDVFVKTARFINAVIKQEEDE